jgi:RHS repeat-associated protein
MKRFTKKINPVLKAFVLFLFILSHVATAAEIYYYHNDHLGTPQVMTDENADVVWQANYTPFGKADVVVETVTNNIRFPGQYFDKESGLHYNYFRDYDPELGGYIQSDPIGLAGGINTYGYVGGNPISFYDPYGLNAVPFPIPALPGIPAPNPVAVAGAFGVGVGLGFNMGWEYFSGQPLGVDIYDWTHPNQYAKDGNQNEKEPKDCPSGTKPIDKVKNKYNWDKDKLHGIKDGAHGGMGNGKSWTGVAPDGTVGINEGGHWSPQGHWTDL